MQNTKKFWETVELIQNRQDSANRVLRLHNRQDNNERFLLSLTVGDIDVHAADASGWTYLHYAAARNNVELIEGLVEYGADINAQTKDGETPLWVAGIFDNAQAVKTLLSLGASEDVVNKAGNHFLYVMEIHKNEEVNQLLHLEELKKTINIYKNKKLGITGYLDFEKMKSR